MKHIINLIMLTLVLTCTAYADSEDKIIKKIETRYSQKNFEADFFQTSTLKTLDIEQTAGGFVIFSHPGKMYWKYNFPDKQEVITNGKKVWIYVHKKNKVTVTDAEKYFEPGTGGALLSNLGSISKNYEINIKKSEKEGQVLLLLKPLETSRIKEIKITALKENGKIIRVKTTNNSNDDTEFRFKNEEFITEIDNSIFTFSPPEDAEITKY